MSLKKAIMSTPGPKTGAELITLFAKAFCMGCADLIPGVSGGTVAFITGIYEDLLGAVSSLNKDFFFAILKLDIKKALSIVHFRVLVPIALGMLTAIFSLARVMHYLINEHAILTWSMFFGLIAASIVVIFKELENPKDIKNIVSLVCGSIFAWLMVSLIPVETPMDSWFVYLCGVIGITAMLLPGLSGSFLLLILGKYEFITGAVKSPFVEGNFIILLTFAAGSLTGLLGFSRILNYFLKNYRSVTMAFLTGILIGSMKKVWPWKETLETVVVRGKVKILREANIMPESFNTQTMFAVALALIGFGLIIYLEKSASKNNLV
jgi:putative membrane protein